MLACFQRGVWTRQGPKLTGSDETGNGEFGYGVAPETERSSSGYAGGYVLYLYVSDIGDL
jgi:hypothetical protein